MPEDRIRNPLPIPEQCDNCASFDIVFTGNERVYGKPYGEWPYVYYCLACDAAVGCHPGTKIPLGRMADKRMRQLRAEVHQYFDPLWQSRAMTRTEAYAAVARHLGITLEECHISQLSIEQLQETIRHCTELLGNLHTLKRRKEKKDAKRVKRVEREQRANERFRKFTKRNSSAGRSRRSQKDSGKDS